MAPANLHVIIPAIGIRASTVVRVRTRDVVYLGHNTLLVKVSETVITKCPLLQGVITKNLFPLYPLTGQDCPLSNISALKLITFSIIN